MTELKLKLDVFAQDIVNQLKSKVPVRTGRLKNGIGYKIENKNGDYWVYIVVEDYFKYLKPRTKTPRLPSPKELAMARPPLPKMNSLGVVKTSELSSRSRGLMDSIDIDSAIAKIDFKDLEDQIRKIVFYDLIS